MFHTLHLLHIALNQHVRVQDLLFLAETLDDLLLLQLKFIDLGGKRSDLFLNLLLFAAFPVGLALVLVLLAVDNLVVEFDALVDAVQLQLLLGHLGLDALQLLAQREDLLGDVGIVPDAHAHALQLRQLLHDVLLFLGFERLGLEHVFPLGHHAFEFLLVLRHAAAADLLLLELFGLLLVLGTDLFFDLVLLGVERLEHVQVFALLLDQTFETLLGLADVVRLLPLEGSVEFLLLVVERVAFGLLLQNESVEGGHLLLLLLAGE